MAKHRKTKTRARRQQARQYVTTGVGGAAMFGVGVLLATAPDAPPAGTPAPEVTLVSFESVLPPQSPAANDVWWLEEDGNGLTGNGLIGSAAGATIEGFTIFGYDPFVPFGPGGWLLGDGEARGIALAFVGASLVLLLVVLLAFVSKPYRELSDAYAAAPPSLHTEEDGTHSAAPGAPATSAIGEAGEDLRSGQR